MDGGEAAAAAIAPPALAQAGNIPMGIAQPGVQPLSTSTIAVHCFQHPDITGTSTLSRVAYQSLIRFWRNGTIASAIDDSGM
jgi:hypothetical protein